MLFFLVQEVVSLYGKEESVPETNVMKICAVLKIKKSADSERKQLSSDIFQYL